MTLRSAALTTVGGVGVLDVSSSLDLIGSAASLGSSKRTDSARGQKLHARLQLHSSPHLYAGVSTLP